MNKIASAIKTFIADENGITAIEYGLMAAVLGAGVIAAATTLGTGLKTAFTAIVLKMVTA